MSLMFLFFQDVAKNSNVMTQLYRDACSISDWLVINFEFSCKGDNQSETHDSLYDYVITMEFFGAKCKRLSKKERTEHAEKEVCQGTIFKMGLLRRCNETAFTIIHLPASPSGLCSLVGPSLSTGEFSPLQKFKSK